MPPSKLGPCRLLKKEAYSFSAPQFPGSSLLSSGATLWFLANALRPGKLAARAVSMLSLNVGVAAEQIAEPERAAMTFVSRHSVP